MTSTSSTTIEQLLWDAELFLRRQLLQAAAIDDSYESGGLGDNNHNDVMMDPYDGGGHGGGGSNNNGNNNNMMAEAAHGTNNGGGVDPSINQSGSGGGSSRGRTVLTILYLCVLGLCFIVPVFYYFRLHCFEENARRELEMDFQTALEQSDQHREESRAARRKYIEERRARIVQLLGPVRMTLKEENFPHLNDPNQPPPKRRGSFLNLDFESEKFNVSGGYSGSGGGGIMKSDNESATMTSEGVFSPFTSDDDDDDDDDEGGDDAEAGVGLQPHSNDSDDDEVLDDHTNGTDLEKQDGIISQQQQQQHQQKRNGDKGVIETKCDESDDDRDDEKDDLNKCFGSGNDDDVEKGVGGRTNDTNSIPKKKNNKSKDPKRNNPYGDEDMLICIPIPGLPMGGSCFLDPTTQFNNNNNGHADREMRLAPGLCTICLSNYKVGSDIVWSSNEACDHHFHFSCIEKWLIKQRDGPLCPCCRRDFIVDPLDLLEEEDNNNNNINNNETDANNGNNSSNDDEAPPIMFSWDPATLDDEEPISFPIIVTAPGGGAGNYAFDPTTLEAGLNPPRASNSDEPEEQHGLEGEEVQAEEDKMLHAAGSSSSSSAVADAGNRNAAPRQHDSDEVAQQV